MSKKEVVKEMTSKEIKNLAENIVSKTSDCKSDYDAIENVESALNGLLENVGVDIKKSVSIGCKCTTCACGKK